MRFAPFPLDAPSCSAPARTRRSLLLCSALPPPCPSHLAAHFSSACCPVSSPSRHHLLGTRKPQPRHQFLTGTGTAPRRRQGTLLVVNSSSPPPTLDLGQPLSISHRALAILLRPRLLAGELSPSTSRQHRRFHTVHSPSSFAQDCLQVSFHPPHRGSSRR